MKKWWRHTESYPLLTSFCCYFSVGWGGDQSVGGFGEEPGMKAQLINLIRSIRIVMRGKSLFLLGWFYMTKLFKNLFVDY